MIIRIKRRLSLIGLMCGLGMIYLLGACSRSSPQTDKKIVVVATVYPITDWVKQVGGKYVELIYLPESQKPLQPPSLSPDLTARISQADIVFEINRELDDWLNPVIHTHVTKNPTVVLLSKSMPALEPYGTKHHVDYDQLLASHSPNLPNIDSHIWLDPLLAETMVLHIADELTAIKPSADKFFHDNAERYMRELTELHFWIEQKLAGLSQRKLPVLRSSFTYYAYRYKLTLIPLDDLLSEQKPSPETIKALEEIFSTLNRKVLALEYPLSNELSRILTQELGIELIYLDPTGTPDTPDRNSYISLMKYNTTQLATALK